jgi:hypothetical protein
VMSKRPSQPRCEKNVTGSGNRRHPNQEKLVVRDRQGGFMHFDLPRPYEDELLHSTCLRYAMRFMPTHADRVLRQLYAGRLPLSAYYPPSLEYFSAANMPHLAPILGQLVEKHTFVPYLMAFQGRSWAESKFSPTRPYDYEKILPLLKEAKFPEHLRWCPRCVQEDRLAYGEAYWRRAHQLHGCWVCMKHGLKLVASKDAGRSWIVFQPAELSIPRQVDPYMEEATFCSERSRALHQQLVSLLEAPYSVLERGAPRIGTLRLKIFGSRYFPSSREITRAFHDMWAEAVEYGVGRELLGTYERPRFPNLETACQKPYLRMMLEIFFAETYGVDLHDPMYVERIGPPCVGLRFRCVSQVARHDASHWVTKYQACRNDTEYVNANCKCGFSFKVHRSLSGINITRSDVVRINRYGDGYRDYIRRRLEQSVSIYRIAKDLGIEKSVVKMLSLPKVRPLIQQRARRQASATVLGNRLRRRR